MLVPMRGRRGALLALVLGVGAFAPLSAQGRPAPSDVPDTLILAPVGAFSSPTYVTAPTGDQDRLFVVQQGGLIRLVIDGVIQTTPFLDASSWISSGGERGLLSMAFPSDYDTTGLFYIYYTDPSGNVRIDEVQRSASDPNVADPSTRRQVIVVPHPSQANHNGGQLQFGPDGLCTSGSATGAARETRSGPARTCSTTAASCSGSTRAQARGGRTGSRRTTRSSAGAARTPRSGPTGSATPGAIRSTA